jgi:hypothetical protein
MPVFPSHFARLSFAAQQLHSGSASAGMARFAITTGRVVPSPSLARTAALSIASRGSLPTSKAVADVFSYSPGTVAAATVRVDSGAGQVLGPVPLASGSGSDRLQLHDLALSRFVRTWGALPPPDEDA